ncbi:STAS-like domain-containing protein [Treponema phagedenis]|uniref:STAS-like domain-containing protein n=1 Tax=Treponema phagedenis TaxID=162 RepID=UPI0020913A60|nr:STAS-like domain-containing protein [Treponema phagedenis]
MRKLKEATLKVAECGSGYKYQGGRFIHISPDSGEEFRNNFLIPFLKKNKTACQLCVDFAGTIVFTSGFLEESFGGAIRLGFETVKKIQFKNIPPEIKKELLRLIKEK